MGTKRLWVGLAAAGWIGGGAAHADVVDLAKLQAFGITGMDTATKGQESTDYVIDGKAGLTAPLSMVGDGSNVAYTTNLLAFMDAKWTAGEQTLRAGLAFGSVQMVDGKRILGGQQIGLDFTGTGQIMKTDGGALSVNAYSQYGLARGETSAAIGAFYAADRLKVDAVRQDVAKGVDTLGWGKAVLSVDKVEDAARAYSNTINAEVGKVANGAAVPVYAIDGFDGAALTKFGTDLQAAIDTARQNKNTDLEAKLTKIQGDYAKAIALDGARYANTAIQQVFTLYKADLTGIAIPAFYAAERVDDYLDRLVREKSITAEQKQAILTNLANLSDAALLAAVADALKEQDALRQRYNADIKLESDLAAIAPFAALDTAFANEVIATGDAFKDTYFYELTATTGLTDLSDTMKLSFAYDGDKLAGAWGKLDSKELLNEVMRYDSLLSTGSYAQVYDKTRTWIKLDFVDPDVAFVPEPGTLALAGLGLGAAVLRRRRRKAA